MIQRETGPNAKFPGPYAAKDLNDSTKVEALFFSSKVTQMSNSIEKEAQKSVGELLEELKTVKSESMKPYMAAHERHTPDLSLTAHINKKLKGKRFNFSSYNN